MENVDINNWIIEDPMYDDEYDYFFESSRIIYALNRLKGGNKEKYIELEKKQNPVHFKKFRAEHSYLFE